MPKLESPSGIVHFTRPPHGTERSDMPYCGAKIMNTWLYTKAKTPVTCKNCLVKWAREKGVKPFKVTVSFGCRANNRGRDFKTKAEAEAYIEGVKDTRGWHHIEIDDQTI